MIVRIFPRFPTADACFGRKIPATEANTYKARMFTVSVQVDSKKGEGGNINELSGNLNAVGSVTEGTFNTTSKEFTANEAATQSINTNKAVEEDK